MGDCMNRMVLTKILKNFIDLYIDDKFTYIYIINTLDNIENEEYDEDKNAYLQASLLSTLFSIFPYYRILNDLNDLGDYIIESTKANINFKAISRLLKNGCLGDMVPDIKRRAQTETLAHIMELIYMYKSGELNPNIVISHLTKNMFDSKILTSMDAAEIINYNQETIPGVELKNISLRENISRSNTNRKENIRRNLEEFVTDNYDEETLEKFIQEVINIIDQSSLSDKELLKNTIYESLISLFAKAVVAWENRPDEDVNQLSFTFK